MNIHHVEITKIWADMTRLGPKFSGMGYVYSLIPFDETGRSGPVFEYESRDRCVEMVDRWSTRQDGAIPITDIAGNWTLGHAPENLDKDAAKAASEMDQRIKAWKKNYEDFDTTEET